MNKKKSKVAFHKDFKPPSLKDRNSALGCFPLKGDTAASRERMLSNACLHHDQSSLQYHQHDNADKNGEATTMALSDLDDRKLYVPTPRSQTSLAIPRPKDEMDWLAQVPEDVSNQSMPYFFLQWKYWPVKYQNPADTVNL